MRNFKRKLSPFVFMILSACGLRSQDFNQMVDDLISGNVETISPDKLNQLSIQSDNVVILDAREKEEYEVSHLPKSKWVGYSNFDMSSLEFEKDAEIIVYCSVGYRSEQIGEKLQDAGYANVKNLHGGIFGWKNKGFEVVDEKGNSTERVHAYNKIWGVWLTNGEKVYD